MIPPRIAVAFERYYRWHERFATALEENQARERWFEFEVVDLDRHDWLDVVRPFDVVLWKSYVLGPEAASYYKEKIYFLEAHLRKLVFPSFKTVWHYESKVAQSYIFAHERVVTPKTVVSFEVHDAEARLDAASPPYVFKRSAGAGSQDVWKVDDRDAARDVVRATLAHQLWSESRPPAGTLGKAAAAVSLLRKRWMRNRVVDRVLGREQFRPVYWQEFIAGNEADLRITVIGGRFACAFWRLNRPDDFRASGSGRIDYARPIPEAALATCIELARALELDTIAFDLVFRDNEPLIVEMSYAYVAEAIANAPGIYERADDGSIGFVPGGRWPQELWVTALLDRLRRTSS